MTPHDLERAMVAPASVFRSPTHVLDNDQLSKDQKIEVLLRWAYDAAEEPAVEEGMRGRDSDLMRRILVALATINAAAAMDIKHPGPSKHHAVALCPQASAADFRPARGHRGGSA